MNVLVDGSGLGAARCFGGSTGPCKIPVCLHPEFLALFVAQRGLVDRVHGMILHCG